MQVINVCLDALENILRLGEAERTINGDNKMAIYVEEADGVEVIQNLQYHEEEGACRPPLCLRFFLFPFLSPTVLDCPCADVTDGLLCLGLIELYEKALRIIRDYFDGEDDEDYDDMAPEVDFDAHQFSFGTAENHSAAGNQFSF